MTTNPDMNAYCTECGEDFTGERKCEALPCDRSPHDPEKCRFCDDITVEEWEELTRQVKELTAELGQCLDYNFRRHAYRRATGPWRGWWDAGSICGVEQDGARLVELGLWERKKSTADSWWWYRPKPQSEETQDG